LPQPKKPLPGRGLNKGIGAPLTVIFVALPKYAEAAEGAGTFMALPVSVDEVAEAVRQLLISRDHR
jgi:hypothetical protein